MTVKTYLLSLPERLVRSVVGLGAGVARYGTFSTVPIVAESGDTNSLPRCHSLASIGSLR